MGHEHRPHGFDRHLRDHAAVSPWSIGATKRPDFRLDPQHGLFDTSGNLLFVSATRAGRLDVAAVLASLYPASTIVLAGWLLKEKLTQRQVWGMGIAVGAVVLITLR